MAGNEIWFARIADIANRSERRPMAELESMITGGLSGLVGTLLTVLGMNHRVTRLENGKMDITAFAQFEKRVEEGFKNLQSAIDSVPDKVHDRVNGHWDGHDRRRT